MALLGPFNVAYPVLFRSGGDTTRVAFGKHIQEIEKIYGILNALDSDKLSTKDLDGKLEGFKQVVSFDEVTGSLDLSRTTGNLDASRVVGSLSNSNIDTSNVNGLTSLILSLISNNVPAPVDKGDGIIESDPTGYIKFNNGFIIQWGKHTVSKGAGFENVIYQNIFPLTFPNTCLNLVLSTEVVVDNSKIRKANVFAQSKDVSESGFNFILQEWDDNQEWSKLHIHYSAIGF